MVINNVDPGSYSDPKAGAITQNSLLSIGNPSPPSGTGLPRGKRPCKVRALPQGVRQRKNYPFNLFSIYEK